MSVAEKRSELMELIEQANEAFIEAAHLLLAGQGNSGTKLSEKYAEHLRPMTQEALTKEIEQSMMDYERGDYMTLEESSKRAASW